MHNRHNINESLVFGAVCGKKQEKLKIWNLNLCFKTKCTNIQSQNILLNTKILNIKLLAKLDF